MFATLMILKYIKSVDPGFTGILSYSLNIGIFLPIIRSTRFRLPRRPNYSYIDFEGWQRSYNENPPETGFTVIGTS